MLGGEPKACKRRNETKSSKYEEGEEGKNNMREENILKRQQ